MVERRQNAEGGPHVIVDTHTHVVATDLERWPLNPAGVGSDWYRTDPVPVETLCEVTTAAGVDGVVLVQAYGAYTFDNRYVVDAAAYDLDRLVSVAIVDFEDPGTPALLRELATRPGFSGVRMFPLGDPAKPQPEWLDDPRTFVVWETCAELGLRMLIAMLPVQLPRLRTVLERFPDQTVALEHCAFASFAGGPEFPEAAELLACAAHPNLQLKVTSTVFEGAEASGSDPRDVMDRLVAEFGADRLMWGSDWPQTRDRPYADLLALARHSCEHLSADDTAKFLGGNAVRLWPELARTGDSAI
jgi:L-fuconolactonase